MTMSVSDHSRGSADTRLVAELSVIHTQECRECHVICERVVSPWRCLRGRRTCIYAYRDGQTTYVGCLHKVFLPELDLTAFAEEGIAGGNVDPYGKVRVARTPRPQCPVTIERAYSPGPLGQSCVNPAFLSESFRVRRSPVGSDWRGAVDTDGLGF